MKRLVAGVISMFALIWMAPSAMADDVIRIPVPDLTPGILHVSSCTFDIFAYTVTNREVATLFFDNSGTLVKEVITGAFLTSFTNLSTGKTMTISEGGPGVFTFHPDGSATLKVSGHEPLEIPPFGDPNLVSEFIGSGHIVYEFTAAGIVTVSAVGHFQDLCQLLS